MKPTQKNLHQKVWRWPKDKFFEVFTPAWINSAKSETAISGFRSTRTQPISPELIPKDVFSPSLTTDRSLPRAMDETAPVKSVNSRKPLADLSFWNLCPLPKQERKSTKRRSTTAFHLTSKLYMQCFKKNAEKKKQKVLHQEVVASGAKPLTHTISLVTYA